MGLWNYIKRTFSSGKQPISSEEAYNLSTVNKRSSVLDVLLKQTYDRIATAAFYDNSRYLVIQGLSRYSSSCIEGLKKDLLERQYTIVYEDEDVILISWKQK